MKDKQNKLHFFRQMAGLTALLLVVGLLPACQLTVGSGFPALESTAASQTDTSQSVTAPTQNLNQRLRVALPLNDQTIEAVRLLYLAKKAGIAQEIGQNIGLDVALESLKQYDTGLSIELINVPAMTGATREQINLWTNANELPDIIYTDSAAAVVGLENCLDLNSRLYSNPLLSADRLNIAALDSGHDGSTLAAIPYLASMPVIYFNETLLNQLQLTAPAANWTWEQWRDFESTAQQAIENAGLSASAATLDQIGNKVAQNEQLMRAVFVMDTPAPLLQWLPASLSTETGWATWNGQQFQMESSIFSSAANWLKSSVSSGYSAAHLTAAQRETALNGSDLITTGRVLMWVGDSAQASTWQENGLQSIVRPIPAGMGADGSARMPLNIRSLAVAATTAAPDLAADFAAFVALDTDSLLMQSRFQLFDGYVPLITDEDVWGASLNRQLAWNWIRDFQARTQVAYCAGQQLHSGWDQAIQNSITTFGNDLLLTDNETAQANLQQQMNLAAQVALQGD